MTHIVDGVPRLLVTGPFGCSEITFVEQLKDASDFAPRKQWIIVISGRVAITTTDGKCREVGPGEVIFLEDTAGRGHFDDAAYSGFPIRDDSERLMARGGNPVRHVLPILRRRDFLKVTAKGLRLAAENFSRGGAKGDIGDLNIPLGSEAC